MADSKIWPDSTAGVSRHYCRVGTLEHLTDSISYRVLTTLRRLEEEQDNFHDFLKRLRDAKDKAEFDQFMEDRAGKPVAGPTTEA